MSINYNNLYPDILSKVEYHKNGKPFLSKNILIKCSLCEKTLKLKLKQFLERKDTKIDLKCKSCSIKTNTKVIERLKSYSLLQKGKTYEELYGKENAIKKINNLKNNIKNIDLTNFLKGNKKYNQSRKGKKHPTWNEIYGEEQSNLRKKNLSKKYSGKKNPMYGKPTPKKAGNGICGWYKNWYFRSLLELSFMINFIERKKINWCSAENKKYRIEYKKYDNSDRTYFADFVLEGKILAEIKPKRLINTPLIQLKAIAAHAFCKNKGLEYKIFTENDFEKLSKNKIYDLYKKNEIKLLKKSHEEYIIKDI